MEDRLQAGGKEGTPRVAVSVRGDTREAIEELLDSLDAEEAVLTFVFYSPRHDEEIIAQVLDRRTGDRGVGGSTAGEISALGFTHGSMTGISFHGDHSRAAVHVVTRLSELSLVPVTRIGAALAERIGRKESELNPEEHAWLFLIDGLSGKEELLTPFFARYSPRIQLVGGSLADEERFESVTLVHRGAVHRDAAAVVLLESGRPFEIVHHTHMEFTSNWFEVTKVSDGGRRVEELNGRVARDAYAEALGIKSEEVTFEVAGGNPLGYRFKGRPFPCSIMRPTDEGHLLMAYSVQEHERLNLLRPVDLVMKSRDAIMRSVDLLRKTHGVDPSAILIFNCLGRYIECQQQQLLGELLDALNQAPICGLNTYGEQFSAMHMNHSMTGIVFG